MNAPLINPAWRTPAAWVCVIAAVGFAVLAVALAGDHSTAFDDWLFRRLFAHTGNAFATLTLAASNVAVSVGICAVTVVVAALVRRWNVVLLAAAGPGGTVLLTRYLFKPLVSRVLSSDDVYHALRGLVPPGESYSVTGAFPSGHESAVASTACVLVIVCCRLSISRRLRAVLVALVAVWAGVAAIGLVRNFWHYATDTIGAICLATVVVVGLALVLDRYFTPVQRRIDARLAARAQLARRT
jgi:undecaprenyl-diphosphatase